MGGAGYRMKKYLLPQFTQYKANLHTHTNVSDGNSSPEEVKAFYKKNGYSIVAYTDHELILDHSDLNDDNFLSITGCEYANTDKTDVPWKYKTTCHLNFLAKEADNTTHVCYHPAPAARFVGDEAANKVKHYGEIFEREHTVECVNHVIKEANSHGFLVAMNHPWWSMEGFNTFSQYDGYFAVEVFNYGCGSSGHYEFTPYIYSELLRMGKKIVPVAADDIHKIWKDVKYHKQAFGGYNMIAAKELTYEGVMEAIENGDMYASSGATINEIYVEDNILTYEVY